MEHNGICKACREKLPYIGEVRCMCCGKPLTDPAEEYCYDCTRQKHLFVDGRSLWVHKDAVENAVYAMKYQNRRIYGQTFGKEMAEHFLPYLWERKITLIVPVPRIPGEKKRGFNQAEIVAKVLSKIPELLWMQVLLRELRRLVLRKSWAIKGENEISGEHLQCRKM